MQEYYRYYLKLHKNPKCRLMHYVGQWTTIIYVIWCLMFSLKLLILAPFIIYPFAWSGHHFFEKNKPAAFNNPIKAKLADWIMFKDICLGRISIW